MGVINDLSHMSGRILFSKLYRRKIEKVGKRARHSILDIILQMHDAPSAVKPRQCKQKINLH
jgi:hypothetical protein